MFVKRTEARMIIEFGPAYAVEFFYAPHESTRIVGPFRAGECVRYAEAKKNQPGSTITEYRIRVLETPKD